MDRRFDIPQVDDEMRGFAQKFPHYDAEGNDTLWKTVAYDPYLLKKLNDETGFVACDEELGLSLIDSGDVQDINVGALHLKEIQDKPKKAPAKKKAAKGKSDEEG